MALCVFTNQVVAVLVAAIPTTTLATTAIVKTIVSAIQKTILHGFGGL